MAQISGNLSEDRDNVYIDIIRFFQYMEGMNNTFGLDKLEDINDISQLDEALLAKYNSIGEQIIHFFSDLKRRNEQKKRRKRWKKDHFTFNRAAQEREERERERRESWMKDQSGFFDPKLTGEVFMKPRSLLKQE